MMASEPDTDSVPSDHPAAAAAAAPPSISGPLVRLMCSFGGRILPRPHDHQLRYVGGDTRIVAVPRSASFSTLLSKLSKIAGSSSVPPDRLSVKYQLPNEDLEALITLTSDEDVDNMMDEYDRLQLATRTPRLRLFLFHPSASILDRSAGSKQDDWFLDALNGSGGEPSLLPLERGRSEASSIISEVPDYLFGFDNNSDETPPAAAGRPLLALENLSFAEPAITNSSAKAEDDVVPVEPQINRQTSYVPNPVWQFVAEPMPVYYVPGPMMPGGSLPVQPVPMPMPFPFVAHQPVQGGGPVYVGGTTQMVGPAYEYPVAGEAYEFVAGGGLMRNNPTVMPMYQAGGIAPAGAELAMTGGVEFRVPRTSQ